MKISIEKQEDDGYIVKNMNLDKNEITGGIYFGGFDDVIKLICSHFEYKVEYLIEDLTLKDIDS
jgi:hypothetical protein